MGSRQDLDVLDDVLGGQPVQPPGQQEIDVLDQVLSGPHDPYTSAGTEPVGSVMTETAPQKEGAGFGTEFQTGFVDDPKTKINIYAAARFPDLPEEERIKKYGIHDGEVVYQGDDGQLRRETPDTIASEAKRWLAQEGAHAPAWVGSILGAIFGGPLGAGGGAMVGEAIRKGVGGAVFDEPQTAGDYAGDMALEGVFGVAGELGGRVASKAINSLGAKRGGKIVAAAGRDRPNLRPSKISEAEGQFRQHGIDPLPPQTTESRALIDKWELLEGMPRTADILEGAKKKQGVQVQESIENFLNDLGPDWTPTRAGEEVTAAAQKSVEKLEKARTLKVFPQYEEAFATAPEIDITSVADQVDIMLKDAPKGKTEEKALKSVRTMLQSDEGLVSNLRTLDKVKKEIDFMLEGPEAASIHKDVKRNLMSIKSRLVGLMDEASPDYRAARKHFEELSPAVTKRQKGLTGQVAKLDGDRVHKAARQLIDSQFSSPASVARARFDIRRQNPEAWDAVVRTYLTDVFEGIKTNVRGEIPNIAGHFYKKVLGNKKQAKILRAAMGDKQFENLEAFGEVLRRVSRIYGKESRTASKQIALQEMKGEGTSRAVGALGIDATSPLRKFSEWSNDALFGRYQEHLARALVDPKAAAQLKRLKQLPPGGEKLVNAFGAFLGVTVGNQAGGKLPETAVGGVGQPK